MTRNEKILRFANIAVVLFMLAVVIISAASGFYTSINIADSYTIDTPASYSITIDGQTSTYNEFPVSLQVFAGEPCTVSLSVPENVGSDYGLLLPNNYCAVELFAEDECIGSYYMYRPPLGFCKMIGNYKIFASISPELAGKTLNIVYHPLYSASMNVHDIYFGTMGDLKLYVLFANTAITTAIIILLTIALFCISISLSHRFKNYASNDWAFYHMGCLLLAASMYLVCTSDLPQFAFNIQASFEFIGLFCLILIPIHYAAFCSEIFGEYRHSFEILQITGWTIPVVQCFLMFTGIMDSPIILSLSQAHMIITFAYAFYVVYKKIKDGLRSVEILLFAVSDILLLLIAASAITVFFTSNSPYAYLTVVGLGSIIFSGLQFLAVLEKEIRYFKDVKAIEVYKELAYTDMMTGLLNRTSFNEMLVSMDSVENAGIEYTLVIFDLNFLKKVNDTMGHFAGDTVIKGAAAAISKAFSSLGKCYRIGGDEFSVIMENVNKNSIASAMSVLESEVIFFNNEHPNMTLSISKGMASDVSGTKSIAKSLFHCADGNMYIDKNKRNSARA